MLRFFGSMTAISIRGKQDEEKLNHYLHHDELTGLYNRRHFFHVLSHAQTGGVFPMTLMMMDVDNLKMINDQHGHLMGDEALIWIARTITGLLPEGAVFARIGGDEFALLIQNQNETEGLQLLERMRRATCEKVSGNTKETPHLSIGMAVAIASNENLQDLLHMADMKMYALKRKRRSSDSIQTSNPVQASG
jgi:diguanylate cyclase (GGDEF)-like protein